ncbi:zinc finger protein 665-like isoform X2 [Wyeomyia smithii]|uniref:zinc finger protein 665-like isoform X2 n=1 Tax=Wyeomyia smithii TaxID=174621 RepID=UPI002467EA50|nr:zinc finger protein 665-like isoform X2 [Wyeomyia smithii]
MSKRKSAAAFNSVEENGDNKSDYATHEKLEVPECTVEVINRKSSRGRPRKPRPNELLLEEPLEPEYANQADDNGNQTQTDSSCAKQNEGKKKAGRRKNTTKSEIRCEICGKTFKFRATLKQHEQIHYGIKEFECTVCGKRFMHKGTLKVHLRLHTGEMPYKCPYCPKRYRGQTALDCHVFRHTKQGTKCPQCSSVFATPSIVKQHIREVHTTERSHTCQICGVTYKHRKSLRLHLRNHQKRNCPDCGKVFSSVYAMMTHRKIHAQDHFQYKCTFCERKFEKEDELQSHAKLRGRGFQCDMCCHSFNKKDYLDNHHRRNHWKELGLEQLKVAAPKNGWNRKGVPKPKKFVSVPLNSVEALAEPSTYNVVTESERLISTLTVYQPDVESETAPANSELIPTTIVTKIEEPFDRCYTLEIQSNAILPSVGVQKQDQPAEVDFDHDYAGINDFGAASYSDDNCLELEEARLETGSVKSEHDFKVELVDISEQRSPAQSCEAETVPKSEILDEEQEQFGSDDEVPLATLASKSIRLKTEKGNTVNNDQDLNSAENNEDDNENIPLSQRRRKSDKRQKRRSSNITKTGAQGGSNRVRQELFCPYCGKRFDGRTVLKKHKAEVHPDRKPNKGPFSCEICGKSYATVSSMVVHRGNHAQYQRYKCDECPKAFTYRCYLENHKRSEHRHERLICPICGKLFKYSQDLKVHNKQHAEDKPFKCDQCPSVFRYPSALRCHKALHVKTVFTCDICQKVFKYDNSLRVHKRLHTGVKRFQCEICNREFHTKAPLVRHLATHSVEREMKCVVCDRIFYKKIELTIHQTKEHPNNPLIGTTVKIHTCQVCGQEFTKKSNLKSHSYIHGDVYKYKCDLCEDQQFKQHAGLRHHLIHFHKLEVRKRKQKEPVAKSSTVDGTLAAPVCVMHNGVEFLVQQIQCE